MKDLVEIPIYLKKETLEKIEKIIEFENSKNVIYKPHRYSKNTVQDFVTGCVYTYLKKMHIHNELENVDDLSKPTTLKNKIKDYLKELGWKQKDLADKSGMDTGNLSYILSNRNQPNLDAFLRIWIALDCPPLSKILYREEE